MPRELTIGSIVINDESPAFVIAEVGHNHGGDMEVARKMFQAAKDAGAHAVKLQKRDNQAVFTKALYDLPYYSENSFGDTYGAHREALEFGWAQYQELMAFAKELDILMFATPFDFHSADFLAQLGVTAYKIASGDLSNTPLLKHVAAFGKPVLLSTGGGTLEDVRRAYEAIMPINPQLCILQCTASYPVVPEEMNLNVITTFRNEFPDVVIGLSDHQNGIALSPVAYVLGARVIEKHFTLDRAMRGTDHAFSLEPLGLRKLVRDLERTWQALGDGDKRPLPSEEKPLYKMAKKLVAARDLPAGHTLAAEDVAIKSPNDGLPPYYFDQVVGKSLKEGLAQDDNITLENLA